MRVILLERMENLGQMGDEVTVKPGYARNFLLPRKKVLRANAANREFFQKQKAQLEAENLKKKSDAEKVAQKVQGLSITLLRQAGEAGQLYGSVLARDIAEGVTAAGCTIARTQVVIGNAIKIIGIYPIKIVLHPEVSAEITVNVARSEEEASKQAAALKAGTPLGPMPPQNKEEEEKPRNKKTTKPADSEANPESANAVESSEAEKDSGEEKPKKKAKKAKSDSDAA